MATRCTWLLLPEFGCDDSFAVSRKPGYFAKLAGFNRSSTAWKYSKDEAIDCQCLYSGHYGVLQRGIYRGALHQFNFEILYDGDWVTLDIIVHGGKSVYHVIDGDTVLAYSKPQVGGMLLPENYPVPSGTFLEDGYIALQAEGTPIDFRKVELKILNENNYTAAPAKQAESKNMATPKTTKEIDKFDSYANSEELSKAWYHPGNGGQSICSLESKIKGAGKHGLKCEYVIEKTDDMFYCRVGHIAKWDLTGCNGVQFWFKPDGSGPVSYTHL